MTTFGRTTETRERYYGLTFWTPNINIFRDPRWGRGQETYGEDPYLTGQMGIPFVKGLQGDDPRYLKAVATTKHFAVHSGPEADRHWFDAVVGDRDLYETYLAAFRDLIVKAKAGSVMGAFNRVNGQSASAHERLLGEILRGEWGFDGYVVSDCGAVDDIYMSHKIVATPEEAAALAVRRGCDLECGNAYGSLSKAVKAGSGHRGRDRHGGQAALHGPYAAGDVRPAGAGALCPDPDQRQRFPQARRPGPEDGPGVDRAAQERQAHPAAPQGPPDHRRHRSQCARRPRAARQL